MNGRRHFWSASVITLVGLWLISGCTVTIGESSKPNAKAPQPVPQNVKAAEVTDDNGDVAYVLSPPTATQVQTLDASQWQAFGQDGDVTLVRTAIGMHLLVKNMPAEELWASLQRYAKFLGYKTLEMNPALGSIETRFKRRKALVPREELRLLARMMYDQQPVSADGVLDKLVIRVEQDAQTGDQRVFMRHQVMIDAKLEQQDWYLLPYDPMEEAGWLVSFQKMIANRGEDEKNLPTVLPVVRYGFDTSMKEWFADGLTFHMPMQTTWLYLGSMVDRAQWQIETADPLKHSMTVVLPADIRTWVPSFMGGNFDLPAKVRLRLYANAEENGTDLTLSPAENDTMTADQKKRILSLLKLAGREKPLATQP